jgi:hypothetical protein
MMEVEHQRQRPLDIILDALQASSCQLRTLVIQMKHGSNIRHLIRQSTWDDGSDEPFHSAEVLGRFVFYHPYLEHVELLNWNISDLDCGSMAEAFRRQLHQASSSRQQSLIKLKTIILSHYHQSSCCWKNGRTTTGGLRSLLAICLGSTTQIENFSILPSLPWTRTRTNSNHMTSTINGSRELEELLLNLLRENCSIKRLCLAVPGMVLSQSTLCQIELYEKLNQAGRRYWRTNEAMGRATWLKLMSQMASGVGPDGQEYSMPTLRYTNDMVFLALKETSHFIMESYGGQNQQQNDAHDHERKEIRMI